MRIPISLIASGLLLLTLVLPLYANPAMEKSVSDTDLLTLENQYLKLQVTPVGTRIIALEDKLRQRQESKVFPHIGGLAELRFGKTLRINDVKTRYVLTQVGDTISGVTHSVPDEEVPWEATVTKSYTLVPGTSRIHAVFTLQNDGRGQIALLPWMRHLLNRGSTAQPQEAHMNLMGAFEFARPHPSLPGSRNLRDDHFYIAAGWTTRVIEPMDESSNTLATVLNPKDIFKIYNWHRNTEDFCTQEVIAAPLFVDPGKSDSWEFDIVITPPVAHIVYASAELVIGASPFPTGIDPAVREITLTFAAPLVQKGLAVQASLFNIDDAAKPLSTSSHVISDLDPSHTSSVTLPVSLLADHNMRLELTFTKEGIAYHPGAINGDTEVIIIPLVTLPEKQQIVYPDRINEQGRLKQIQPQKVAADIVAKADWTSVFEVPVSDRVFLTDTLVPTAESPQALTFSAPANSYESLQLALIPAAGSKGVMTLHATSLQGPDGHEVTCESTNKLLYVHTEIPSHYDAHNRVGNYPEGLLPVTTIELDGQPNVPLVFTYHVPPDAAPGTYTGQIQLSLNDDPSTTLTLPVTLTVWAFALPVIHPWCDTPSSLKGVTTGGITINGSDGKPLSRAALTRAIEDMHLKYRLTPCDAGITNDLLALRFEAFEKNMDYYLAMGATKIYLGSAQTLLKLDPAVFKQVEAYLEKKGWTNHFYVRPGFDEASPDLLPVIRAVCEKWKAISKIPLMETYYHDAPMELYDMLDIYTRSVNAEPWVRERMGAGDHFWKVNAFAQNVEAPRWTTYRRYAQLFDYRFTGTYIWTVKFWVGVKEWYVDYWADGGVGNLSAVLMWPHETGILSSLGLEAQRDAIETNLMLWLLREQVEKTKPDSLTSDASRQALVEAKTWLAGPMLSEQINSAADAMALYHKAGLLLDAIHRP